MLEKIFQFHEKMKYALNATKRQLNRKQITISCDFSKYAGAHYHAVTIKIPTSHPIHTCSHTHSKHTQKKQKTLKYRGNKS